MTAVPTDRPIPAPPSRLRTAYALEVNEWNGTRRLQLLLRHVEKAV